MSGFFSSSIGRKIVMALSAIFLMLFLLLHVTINFISVVSEDLFNQLSHFMGTNLIVQFLMQPILIAGVVVHFVMGFVLEAKNRSSRAVNYAQYSGGENSSWMSRNMIYSGLVILAFLGLHFADFWIPEINVKYIQGDMSGMHNGEFRYWDELNHKFEPAWRTIAYVGSFILLSLHLLHGFTSSLQSMGITAKGKKVYGTIGKIYAIVIPVLFIIVAIYHHFNQIH